LTLLSAGRVGRAHGRAGSFYVERPDAPLEPGSEVFVAGERRKVLSHGGTPQRPLVQLAGVEDRGAAVALHGETLLVEGELESGEWLAHELVGCEVQGLGRVARVIAGPSCDLLELADGTLVPLVSDAVRSIDVAGRLIEVDQGFLGER
jgi:16S rRNA processing protein RimM